MENADLDFEERLRRAQVKINKRLEEKAHKARVLAQKHHERSRPENEPGRTFRKKKAYGD